MSRGVLWVVVAISGTMLAAIFALLGLSIDVSHSAGPIVIMIATLPLVAYRARMDERVGRIADVFEGLTLFWLIAIIGCLASYAVAAVSTGFVDETLAAVDRSIGFDWLTLYRMSTANAELLGMARLAYLSILVSPTIILTWLALSGRMDRARTFLVASGLALIITIALFYYFPARGALAYYVGSDPPYMPVSALSQIGVIEGLRDGTLTTIDIARMHGLITFPSFHATSAALFIWAAWPVRLLRWPIMAINAAMIAATPIEGTHYLIDIIGGLFVAALAVGVMTLPRLRMSTPVARSFRTDAAAA